VKIYIEDILSSPTEITFTEDAQELCQVLFSGQDAKAHSQEYSFEESVSIRMSHFRSEKDIFLNGTIQGSLSGQCGRCLEAYAFSLDRAFSLVLSPQPTLGQEIELGQELREDELSTSFYQGNAGDTIDVSALVQEQILLTLPSVPLCKETCRGLCSQCGVDLNQETCECQQTQQTQQKWKEQDPRLAILSSLRVSPQGATK
jgi:uncharacterized protein